jgi:hypothetical protein
MKTEGRATAEEPAETETTKSTERTWLFSDKDAEGYRSRWLEVQARFVDAPRESVDAADKLVADVIRQLTTVFADQQKQLESELQRSGKLSTEDLRLALRRYRTFFDRLLSI